MTRDRLLVLSAGIAAAVLVVCLWQLTPAAVAVGATTVMGVVLAVLGRRQAVVERRRWDARRMRLYDVAVHVEVGSHAFTAGPLIPRVFIGRDLFDLLDDEELRAVVLHEEAHRRHLDPLRAEIGRFGWSSSRQSTQGEQRLARREIRADCGAMSRGASRSAIAAALLKVPSVAVNGVGFAPASEIRVRALLGDDVSTGPSQGPAVAVAVGIGVGGVLCVKATHLLVATLTLAVCCA